MELFMFIIKVSWIKWINDKMVLVLKCIYLEKKFRIKSKLI